MTVGPFTELSGVYSFCLCPLVEVRSSLLSKVLSKVTLHVLELTF